LSKIKDNFTFSRVKFFNTISFRIVVLTILATIISTPIADFISVNLKETGFFGTGIGAYVMSFLNIIVLTLTIFIFFQRIIINSLSPNLLLSIIS